MSLICPTVTATDINSFNNQLNLVSQFCQRIHIDFMDGIFTPTKSPDVNDLMLPAGYIYDLHVMFKKPIEILDKLISLKPHLIILHAEATIDIIIISNELANHDIKTGLAILPQTNSQDIKDLLPYLGQVLIFGGNLGYHGGQANLSQLAKAAELKAMAGHLELAWDGGANASNVALISQAGIDVINVGSSIHKSPDPAAAYNRLQTLVS